MTGVTSYKIDLESKMVVVIGDIIPFEVLESVSKVKYAELWSAWKLIAENGKINIKSSVRFTHLQSRSSESSSSTTKKRRLKKNPYILLLVIIDEYYSWNEHHGYCGICISRESWVRTWQCELLLTFSCGFMFSCSILYWCKEWPARLTALSHKNFEIICIMKIGICHW